MDIDECPSISWTILGCTPLVRSRVAQVCLRSWNLVSSGSPVLFSKGFQERLCRLWTLMDVPTPVQKTHSPSFLCLWSASMEDWVSLMLLLPFRVLGASMWPL